VRVVVAGAGLGGLCVAHGLRRAGADVEVLEAGAGIEDFGQGYRINVNAAGHGALRACLDDERFRAYEGSLHRQGDPAVYLYSPALDLLSRSQLAAVPGAVDRGTLRRLLADGLGDRVRFGRAVTSVASVASVASMGGADLIVAADGAGSALRRELGRRWRRTAS
jgi:2-polyprenyl-6-methoxyphenol hydroxylase-like FAD-dependent oxidoreductase